MKNKIMVRSFCLCAAWLGSNLSSSWAANVTKLDTTSMAATVANWSAAPAATDIGEFNGTASAASLAGLTLGGADLTLGGVLFDGTMQGPAIVATGNNLILGASGIDLSAANQNVTLNCAVTLGGAQSWNVVSPQTLTVGGIVAITNLLTINGAGAVTLGGINTGAGGLTISNGFVTIGTNTSAGTGTITLAGGTLVINGLTITNAVNVTGAATVTNGGSAATFSGNFTGAGTLNLIESTNNTLSFIVAGQLSAFTGTVKVSDAMPVAYVRFSSCTGSTAATFDLGNGSVILHTRNGNAVSLGALKGGAYTTLEGARSTTATNTPYSIGANNASTTFYGTITNGTVAGATVSLTKVGTGTLTLAGTNNASATGPTEVSAGTLQIGDGNADGSLISSNVIIDAAGTLSFDRPDSYTITNSIANAGALTVFGGGTNTYNTGTYTGAGAINVNSGGFVLASPVAALGPVSVGSGATFDVSQDTSFASVQSLSGSGTMNIVGGSLITVTVTGGVSPGGSGTAGTLTINGGLTENGGVNNQFVLSNVGGTNDLLTVNGNLTVSGLNTITLTAFGGGLISGGIYPLITYSGALSLSTGVLTNNFQVVAFGNVH